jgi:hypothetical protein
MKVPSRMPTNRSGAGGVTAFSTLVVDRLAQHVYHGLAQLVRQSRQLVRHYLGFSLVQLDSREPEAIGGLVRVVSQQLGQVLHEPLVVKDSRGRELSTGRPSETRGR